MRQTISVRYFARRMRVNGEGKVPIYMRIVIGGQRLSIPTKIHVRNDDWTGERIKGTHEDAKTLNQCLNAFTLRAFDLQRELMEEGRAITIDNIKCKWYGLSMDRPRMFLPIFYRHNQQVKALVGKEFSPLTFERYETSYRHTRSFLQWKYGNDDIDVRDLQFQFIADYEFWLKAVRRCSHNTTVKYLSNFRKIVNICRKNGWIDKDPFVGFKMVKRQTEPTFLNQEELMSIIEREFTNQRTTEVRDIFVFCCFTGLSYVDVERLTSDNITTGVDGEKWIWTKRKKTDTPTRVPLLPMAQAILDRYRNHVVCTWRNRLLPVGGNQKINIHLKDIAAACGIKKKVTFHTSRHTFATTVTLANGVPIETVSKLLGHRNLKATQHYAKVLDMKISEDVARLKMKYAVDTISQAPPTSSAPD